MHCRKIECDILLYLGKKSLKPTYLENGCIIMRMCPSMPFLRLLTKTSCVLVESWAILSSTETPFHPTVLKGSGAILEHFHLSPGLGDVCSPSP